MFSNVYLFLLATVALAPLAHADQNTKTLEEITVFGHIGEATSAATATVGVVAQEQIQLRPVSRSAELLEFVPGLVATQHSGEGKANQYFLRGFNLDHGTDFAVRVDGLPVNMPTHAHGHGYADLNFMIPELVQQLSYRKGPYYAEVGDFSAAGSADFSYVKSLERGVVNLTAGTEDYYHLFVGDSYDIAAGELLLAGALTRYEGPWELDQDLEKFNSVLKYHRDSGHSSWSLTAMAYDNSWNATDQIPRRAFETGQVSRFGNIDASDGGDSHRYSMSLDWEGRLPGGSLNVNAYAIDYELDLFSNFTYFLDDPVRGDQFEQFDDRRVYGFDTAFKTSANILGATSAVTVGLQARYDDIALGLYRTEQRQRFATTRQDKVQQGSLGAHVTLDQAWHPKFRTIAAARVDRYRFDVEADLPDNSGKRTDSLLSPKVSFVIGPWQRTQYYLSFGQGFHSNDARGTTTSIDPATGDNVGPASPLSKARSAEFGVRSDVFARTQLAASVFSLKLDSELVFVGDAGATEALTGSRRYGMELAAFHSPVSWLTIDANVALTHARLEDSPGGDRIPQSVSRSASCGVVIDGLNKWSGGVRLRYLGGAPLIEDNSVRSDSTLTVNLEASYELTRSWSFEVGVYNALDSDRNDITYFYDSRLPGEDPEGVSDTHFHPVEPRTFRLTLKHRFP